MRPSIQWVAREHLQRQARSRVPGLETLFEKVDTSTYFDLEDAEIVVDEVLGEIEERVRKQLEKGLLKANPIFGGMSSDQNSIEDLERDGVYYSRELEYPTWMVLRASFQFDFHKLSKEMAAAFKRNHWVLDNRNLKGFLSNPALAAYIRKFMENNLDPDQIEIDVREIVEDKGFDETSLNMEVTGYEDSEYDRDEELPDAQYQLQTSGVPVVSVRIASSGSQIKFQAEMSVRLTVSDVNFPWDPGYGRRASSRGPSVIQIARRFAATKGL